MGEGKGRPGAGETNTTGALRRVRAGLPARGGLGQPSQTPARERSARTACLARHRTQLNLEGAPTNALRRDDAHLGSTRPRPSR
eukprot:12458351-Alexandrium_andersonii.AAC.1